ncbi:MAG: hypothetical protein AAB658_22320, partial [Chloroflexota bacterium]
RRLLPALLCLQVPHLEEDADRHEVKSQRPKATKRGARTSTRAALPAVALDGKMKRLATTLEGL